MKQVPVIITFFYCFHGVIESLRFFFSLYFLANFFVQVLNQIQFPSLFRIFFPVSILIHRYCLIKLCLRYLIPADIE